MQPGGNDRVLRTLKPFVLLAGIIIVALIGYLIYQAQQFHVVSTNPSVNNVATVTPFFEIHFSKPPVASSLSLSSSYSVAKSYSLQGKTLTVILKSPMSAGYSYYIKINHVADASGQAINNKVFTFVPQVVASQDLPADQQKALNQAQVQSPRSVGNINFVNVDGLTNYGLASAQVANLEQEFFNFNSKANKVTVNTSTISPVPHDPNSSSTTNAINFSVQIDAVTYNATIDYSSDLVTVRLVLYNPGSGTPVFDSNNKPLVGNPGSY